MEKALTIRACAVATGVTPDTLRYYEKIGLLTRVPREPNGHRRFGEAEVRWITFLRRLHDTGMPIRHMLQYARLLRRGDATTGERRALLEHHRQEVRARMRALSENLRMIEKKIRHYDALGAPETAVAPRRRRPTRPLPSGSSIARAPAHSHARRWRRAGGLMRSLHPGSELVSHRQTG